MVGACSYTFRYHLHSVTPTSHQSSSADIKGIARMIRNITKVTANSMGGEEVAVRYCSQDRIQAIRLVPTGQGKVCRSRITANKLLSHALCVIRYDRGPARAT